MTNPDNVDLDSPIPYRATDPVRVRLMKEYVDLGVAITEATAPDASFEARSAANYHYGRVLAFLSHVLDEAHK